MQNCVACGQEWVDGHRCLGLELVRMRVDLDIRKIANEKEEHEADKRVTEQGSKEVAG